MIAKSKDVTRKRITAKLADNQRSQAIHAFAHIRSTQSQENFGIRSE
jgi:hypothetical protein